MIYGLDTLREFGYDDLANDLDELNSVLSAKGQRTITGVTNLLGKKLVEGRELKEMVDKMLEAIIDLGVRK